MFNDDKHGCEGVVFDKKSNLIYCGKDALVFTEEFQWFCLDCLPVNFDLEGNYKKEKNG